MSWQQSLEPQNTGTSNVLQGIWEVPNLLWKFRELLNKNENKIKIKFLEKYLGNLGSSQLTLEVPGTSKSKSK